MDSGFTRPETVDILVESIRILGREGVHRELILGDEMMRQKIDYIHNNPVNSGYVESPEHWRYSSARDYAGMEGLLEVCRQW